MVWLCGYWCRCHPQHGAAGLREESQSYPASCGLWLRHETVGARPGQRQSQSRLSSGMDWYVDDLFIYPDIYLAWWIVWAIDPALQSVWSISLFITVVTFVGRYQRTGRIRARFWSTGSLPRGADQLVRFPVPTGIHPGPSNIGFFSFGKELWPRYLHRPGK